MRLRLRLFRLPQSWQDVLQEEIVATGAVKWFNATKGFGLIQSELKHLMDRAEI